MNNIDVVLTWVDGSDPAWLEEKNNYLLDSNKTGDYSSTRFRNWNNLQYVFRGIERFMPWVNKVYFVTWGHIPRWLNIKCKKLNIVNHRDYIPKKYLPTFNSNVIELNLHRIQNLSEQFIVFNDDMFAIKPMNPEDFFENGKPKDMACISPQPIQRNIIANIELNNLEVLNDYFSVDDIKKNKKKWLNIFLYGQYAIRTAIFLQFKSIIGIYEPHIPYRILKSTMNELWKKEVSMLDDVCMNKFRTNSDVNIWLMRSWQLLSGNFIPQNKDFGKLISAYDLKMVYDILNHSKYKIVCINDDNLVIDFENIKIEINKMLEKLLPQKSMFEL